jgi:hypothetical protein
MESWIGPRVAESTRCRRNPALRGLIRSRFDPVVAGSKPAGGLIRPWSGLIRSRLDPVVPRLTRGRVNPAGGLIQ